MTLALAAGLTIGAADAQDTRPGTETIVVTAERPSPSEAEKILAAEDAADSVEFEADFSALELTPPDLDALESALAAARIELAAAADEEPGS